MFLIKKNRNCNDIEDVEIVSANKFNPSESVIGSELILVGNIKGSGKVSIHSQFDGTAEIAGTIAIGEAAMLKADLKAKNVIVAGKIAGQIYASESVKILSTGYVKGTITSKDLVVEQGAKFVGSSVVIEEDSAEVES